MPKRPMSLQEQERRDERLVEHVQIAGMFGEYGCVWVVFVMAWRGIKNLWRRVMG